MKRSVITVNIFSKERGQIFTARWCPLVLLVKISWRLVGRSETKKSKEVGSELFEQRGEEGG
jgi:hypothetical protein